MIAGGHNHEHHRYGHIYKHCNGRQAVAMADVLQWRRVGYVAMADMRVGCVAMEVGGLCCNGGRVAMACNGGGAVATADRLCCNSRRTSLQ